MGFCHKPGTETQLDIIKACLAGILHVFIGNSAVGLVVHQHPRHPFKLANESHNTWLRAAHLDIRAQSFQSQAGRAKLCWRPSSRIVSNLKLPSRWRCRSIKGESGSITLIAGRLTEFFRRPVPVPTIVQPV